MQGTIVMLMALSGLGCHHKSCDVAYVPSYYDSCYSGRRHGCLLSGLFHCFGGWGGSWKQGCGLFGGHHRGYGYDDGYYGGDYYSTSYSDYSPAVFGSTMPIYETPMTTGQG